MASKHGAWALLFLFGILFLSQLNVVRADDGDDDDTGAENPDDIEVSEDDGGDDYDDDYDDAPEDEWDGTVAAHPDVHTRVVFPDYASRQFVAGKPIVALVSFSNRARKPFNVTAVGAHLHSPFDFSYYIQNFTAREQDSIVSPGYQVSIEYPFMADPSLEPLEYWLSAWVQYNDSDGRTYRTTFTNGTIELIEKPSEFNIKTFFGYVVVAALVAVGGFVVYTQQSGSSRSRSTKAVERGTGGAASSGGSSGSSGGGDGWGAVYVPKAQAGRVSRGKTNKTKKSAGDS